MDNKIVEFMKRAQKPPKAINAEKLYYALEVQDPFDAWVAEYIISGIVGLEEGGDFLIEEFEAGPVYYLSPYMALKICTIHLADT